MKLYWSLFSVTGNTKIPTILLSSMRTFIRELWRNEYRTKIHQLGYILNKLCAWERIGIALPLYQYFHLTGSNHLIRKTDRDRHPICVGNEPLTTPTLTQGIRQQTTSSYRSTVRPNIIHKGKYCRIFYYNANLYWNI